MEKTLNGLDKAATERKKSPLGVSILKGLLFAFSLVVFAYGFKVTQVSFKEINSPTRRESLTRVLRALAKPDLFRYDQIETSVQVGVYVPCQEGVSVPPPEDTTQPYLVLSPACADPRTKITVEGFNFEPNYSGPVFFIPPSEVQLNMGKFETDAQGYFKVEANVPPRPNEQMQNIRAITRINIGSPHLTQTAYDTWGKIVETVFLSLLATAFGIILAVPISFLAAQNLMREITSPMSSLAMAILGWPVGIGLGMVVARWVERQSESLTSNLLLSIAGIAVCLIVIVIAARWALPQEEEHRPGLALRIARILALSVAALAGITLLYLTANFAIVSGIKLEKGLGVFGFLGIFVENLGEILRLIVVPIAAIAGGAVVSGLFSRLGTLLYLRLPRSLVFGANIVLGTIAGAMITAILAAGLNWFYEFRNLERVYAYFLVVGAVLGALAAVLTRKRDILPVGFVVYTIIRTILNFLRAIEALIWVIVFVVWVGIGPFAGVLALSLHTIAALAKLYSEQVESILPGPLEAVKATGATRLQSIVYAVVPQIVPPYISFTIYRWDINVRMSTIIGFAGGGGIGFLLFQNINLLNYRAASAQMFAIAIVVSVMDYMSAILRNRIV
jgi:phosphonate ABC transporter permease subunit PhnE